MSQHKVLGIQNFGNTCYLNSVLQSLIHTTDLVKYLVGNQFTKEYEKKNAILVSLRDIFIASWIHESQTALNQSVFSLKKEFGKLNSNFDNFDQQDANEFLLHILDYLHENIKYKISVEINNVPQNPTKQQELVIQSIQQWEGEFKNNYSYVVENFYGQFQSTVLSYETKKMSIKFEPFNYLSLPIPNTTEPINIYNCLNLFTEQEDIDSKMLKKITLWKLPNILIITFNRFASGFGLSKINKKVDFPFELDINKYLTNFQEFADNVKYSLYGVVNHIGGMGGGHYYSYCKNKGNWYEFNDSRTKQLSESAIITPNAYILFYKKQ